MSPGCRNKVPRLIFLFTIILYLHSLYSLPVASALAGQKNPAVQNTVIIWTGSSKLKAVTLVSARPGQKPIGIIAVPIITTVENNHLDTLEGLYNLYGRKRLTAYLEKHFQIPIKTYFCIDQKALYMASEVIGPITMAGKKTTLLEVFEGTYTDERPDLQVEIRALAKELLKPEMLIKIPHLIWIFTRNVETNLGPAHFLTFYQVLRGEGPNILRKEALPGRYWSAGGARYHAVAPEAWIQVYKSVTQNR